MKQGAKELVVLEGKNPAELFKPNGLDPILSEVNEKSRSIVVGDIRDRKTQDDIRSIAARIGSTKATLKKIGTKYTESMRAAVKESNAERDRGVSFLQALQDEIRQPLTDLEEREKALKAEQEARIAEIEDVTEFDTVEPDSTAIESRLADLEKIYQFGWVERFKNRARFTYDRAKDSLTAKLEARKTYEAEQAELEKLRAEKARREKEDEERRIREEAAEQARLAAEEKARIERESAEKEAADKLAAEQERTRREKERAEQAERDRIAAEKKAAEDKEAAIKAEKDRIAAEELRKKEDAERREADKKHRAKINNEAAYCLKEIEGVSEDMAKEIVTSIARREIPNVRIMY